MTEHPHSWNIVKQTLIDNWIELPHDASEEARRAELHSQSMNLRKAFLDDAIDKCIEIGMEPGTQSAFDLIEKECRIASDIVQASYFFRLPYRYEERKALSGGEVRSIFTITHQIPYTELVSEAQKGGFQTGSIRESSFLKLDFVEFQLAIGNYLASKTRLPIADKLLLIALFDIEITLYLRRIYEKDLFTGKSLVASQTSPLRNWLLGRIWSTVRLVIVGGLIGFSASKEWIGLSTAAIMLFVAVGFFLISNISATLFYLSNRKASFSKQILLVTLPMEMIVFYSELHSEGPLSVKHVRSRAQKLADMGAIWPGGVWALLDDMEFRGVISMS